MFSHNPLKKSHIPFHTLWNNITATVATLTIVSQQLVKASTIGSTTVLLNQSQKPFHFSNIQSAHFPATALISSQCFTQRTIIAINAPTARTTQPIGLDNKPIAICTPLNAILIPEIIFFIVLNTFTPTRIIPTTSKNPVATPTIVPSISAKPLPIGLLWKNCPIFCRTVLIPSQTAIKIPPVNFAIGKITSSLKIMKASTADSIIGESISNIPLNVSKKFGKISLTVTCSNGSKTSFRNQPINSPTDCRIGLIASPNLLKLSINGWKLNVPNQFSTSLVILSSSDSSFPL